MHGDVIMTFNDIDLENSSFLHIMGMFLLVGNTFTWPKILLSSVTAYGQLAAILKWLTSSVPGQAATFALFLSEITIHETNIFLHEWPAFQCSCK